MKEPSGKIEKKSRTLILLILLLILAAILIRAYGINFGLPYLYHPDEPNKIQIAQRIIKTGDWDPHYYLKPSLFIYLNTIIYYPYYGLGHILGRFDAIGDIQDIQVLTMGVGYAPDANVVLMGRVLTLLFGAGCVVLCFLLARKVSNSLPIGLLAALLAAFSPTMVTLSRYITPDTQMTFFLLLTWYFTWKIYKTNDPLDYFLAGIFGGLTVSTKYNGGLILFLIPVAYLMHAGRLQLARLLTDRRLWLAAVAAVGAFLLTTPGVIISTRDWFSGLSSEFIHYQVGHVGSEGQSLFWYLTYALKNEPLILFATIIFLILGILSRSKDWIFVGIFPVVYFGFISVFSFHNDRTLLPCLPFFILMTALLIKRLWDTKSAGSLGRKTLHGIALAAIGASSLLSIGLDVRNSHQMTRPDPRELARQWIDQNITPGSKIALEAYTPYVAPQKYVVTGVQEIIANDLAWYRYNQFDYLIFSSYMYQRYFTEADRFQDQVNAYDSFFTNAQFIQAFVSKDFEIRIYRIN